MRNAGRKLAFLTHNQTFSKQIVSVATRVILFHKITSPPGDNPLFSCGKPRNCFAISGGRPMAAPTVPYGTARQTEICSPGTIRAVTKALRIPPESPTVRFIPPNLSYPKLKTSPRRGELCSPADPVTPSANAPTPSNCRFSGGRCPRTFRD